LRKHPQFAAYAALICLCFFWGTTYLAIRIALDSLPPATLVSARNFVSGLLTLAVASMTRAQLPRGRELWITAGLGVMILGAGNGCLALAEQWIPTGLAALFIAPAPFYYAAFESILPGGDRLHAPTIRAMLIGFAGILLLVGPPAFESIAGTKGVSIGFWAGFWVLQFSQASWSLGAIIQRRKGYKTHPIVAGAIQQLATGICFLLPAAFEKQAKWDVRGVSAMLYLAIFGGILGYSCFVYVMKTLPVTVASSYTYVNPVVAVALGWLVFREPFGLRETAAMAIIFLGVWLVRRAALPVEQLRADGAAESG
jgi:drug/metabolite transporter (DMT)-like permease